ncbi:MAG TPA: hypothetical protein VFB38_20310 [Chthonomonadaceae bacterium]|nr:hypothetical protein [Chthonomonadaceae bacterium]
MRVNIPTPVVALIITVVVLVLGYVFWQGTSPGGANAEKTERMLRKAFGGGRAHAAPTPPAGATKPAGVPGISFPDR